MVESIKSQQQGFVSFQDSCKEAKKLLAKYREQIADANNFPSDEGVSPFQPDKAIQHFLGHFPKEVLEEFYGHGISKNGDIQIVGAFLNILANRSMKGDMGRLATGDRTYIPAYTRSPFLILSHYKKDLAAPGPDNRPQYNSIGLRVDVGAFVVNNDYYPMIDELRTMFPEANIIKANELPAYIQSEIEKERNEH